MKPIVVLDVALFAIPGVDVQEAQVHDVLARLKAWSSLASAQNVCDLAVEAEVIAVLQRANSFPATGNILALLELCGLHDVYSARDVNARIFRILDRAKRLPEVFGIEVTTISEFEIDGVQQYSPVLRDSIARTAATVILANSQREEFGALSRLAIADPSADKNIQVIGTVAVAEEEEPTQKVSGAVATVRTPGDFLASLQPVDVWTHADCGQEIALAILLQSAADRKRALDVPFRLDDARFRVGTEFKSSLDVCQASGKGRFSEAVRKRCAAVVCGFAKSTVRPFARTRAEDGAKALRVHVTKSHEALRLMAWRCPDGVLEFATVGVKRDLKIADGVAKDAYFCMW